jgi:phenylalanyl-tRNA synthetase beta chain
MKVPLRWLREFVDLPGDDPAAYAEVLSNLGLEVEAMETLQAPFCGVVVARVAEIRRHPEADKLGLVRLDTGSGEQEVVCGAWNFAEGDLVPLATVGATLDGGLEVGEREIRGVSSAGMICSEAELGLGEDAAGILVLEEDGFEVGSDLAACLPYPDVVYDLSITPNRSDAMSVYGVARDLAAFYRVPLATPQGEVEETGEPTTAKVVVEDSEGSPRFTVREIRNVEIGPSPLWMRLMLRDAGMRPISNVVDITNYVTLECGQPIHAYDMDLLDQETLVVRRARKGEKLTTLDGVERTLHPDDLVISGPKEALGLAGVMGGESSEVGEQTSRILLEVAHFSAPDVLLTGWRHGLRSEAQARNERGVDPQLPPLASARAARMMAELAGGEVAPGFVDVYPDPIEPARVSLPKGEPRRLLGIDLEPAEISDLLVRLGFTVEGEDPFQVAVPTYRPDVTRAADLVEELARLNGYDKIPSSLPRGPGEGLPVWEQRRRLVRRTMAGAGFHEIMSYSFVGRGEIEALGLPGDDPRRLMVAVRNPLSEEQGFLRSSLLPSVLGALRVNLARGRSDVAVFEVGRVFFPSDDEVPYQPQRLTFAAGGRRPGPLWQHGEVRRDARDAVGVWETLAEALGVDYTLGQAEETPFHPGRCGVVSADGSAIGVIGELHPRVASVFGIDERVALGDFDLDVLLKAPAPWVFHTPSSLPPVVFDLAFDLDQSVAASMLTGAIREAAGPGLERLEIFDVFSGPPLDQGRKSIAVRLTFRHRDRTLTDEELVPVREAIVESVAANLDGRLRGV